MKRIKFPQILALAIFILSPATTFAEWKIYYTGQAARMFGSAGRGSFATQAECEAYRAKSAAAERNNCYCAGSDSASGSNAGFQGTPEQQLALGLLDGLLKSIFAKPDTSRQAEIDRQNAILRQQAEQQERQRQQAEEMEKQRQLQLQKELELARQKKFDEDKGQLLDSFKDARTDELKLKGGGEPASELKLKPLGTDFFQNGAVDLKGKQGAVQSLTTREEQAKRDLWYEEQIQAQGFSDLAPIPENGIPENALPASKLEDSKEYKIVDAYLDQIAKFPGGKLPAYVGKIMLSATNHAFSAINATTAAILNGTPPPEAVANGTVVQNIIYKTAESMTIDKAVDIGKNFAAKLGIGYLNSAYGKSTEATTKLALQLGEDTQKIVEIWFAKRY